MIRSTWVLMPTSRVSPFNQGLGPVTPVTDQPRFSGDNRAWELSGVSSVAFFSCSWQPQDRQNANGP